MRHIIPVVLAACVLALGATPSAAYKSGELLKSCVEADNDARWGEVAELECEQYILGFIHALKQIGYGEVCPPETNTADEVRWAYMRWFHEDYAAHTDMEAGAALLATLKSKFRCE